MTGSNLAVIVLAAGQGIAEKYGSLGAIYMSRKTATVLGERLEKRAGRLYPAGGSATAALEGILNDVREGRLSDFRMVIRGQQRVTNSD